MMILVKGKIYNTDDVPALILFIQHELEQFRSEPPNIDIKCSFPPEWSSKRGEEWMLENRDKLIRARDAAMRKSGNVVKTEILNRPLPNPVVMSDEKIKDLIDGFDEDSIEFEDETGMETGDDR